jgi:hypothetical protein
MVALGSKKTDKLILKSLLQPQEMSAFTSVSSQRYVTPLSQCSYCIFSMTPLSQSLRKRLEM